MINSANSKSDQLEENGLNNVTHTVVPGIAKGDSENREPIKSTTTGQEPSKRAPIQQEISSFLFKAGTQQKLHSISKSANLNSKILQTNLPKANLNKISTHPKSQKQKAKLNHPKGTPIKKAKSKLQQGNDLTKVGGPKQKNLREYLLVNSSPLSSLHKSLQKPSKPAVTEVQPSTEQLKIEMESKE